MNKIEEMKGAILDMDGTLLDSMGIWDRIDHEFLARRGLECPDDYKTAVAALNSQRAAAYTIERFGFSDSPEELIAEWFGMCSDFYLHEAELKPYAKEYCEKLKQDGIPMILATASELTLVIPAMERTGLLGYFDSIVTASEVARGKGFPDIYQEAARRLRLPESDCAVFEDILPGLTGAGMGDFYRVGVYDVNCRTPEEEMRAACDLYIRSFAELM